MFPYIDFTTTTVDQRGRADILRRTYDSFAANLQGVDLDSCRLYLNIDRGPDPVGYESLTNVAQEYFLHVVFNETQRACFPAAVRWLWSEPDEERFFHLEDDWICREPINVPALHALLDADAGLSCVNLRAYVHRPSTMGICLSPGLWRTSHAKAIAATLTDDRDPELQLREGKQGIYRGVQCPSDRSVIEDIGREFMAHNGLRKNMMNGHRLTAWETQA